MNLAWIITIILAICVIFLLIIYIIALVQNSNKKKVIQKLLIEAEEVQKQKSLVNKRREELDQLDNLLNKKIRENTFLKVEYQKKLSEINLKILETNANLRAKEEQQRISFKMQKDKQEKDFQFKVEAQNIAYQNKIEELVSMSQKEVKSILFKKVIKDFKDERKDFIEKYTNETKIEAYNKARNILLNSMERISETISQNSTTSSIALTDVTVKGKIIGKDGKNRAAFERITGTSLIIDESDTILISSFNPIRREIAARTMMGLLNGRSIQTIKIENQYEKSKNEFNIELEAIGADAVTELKFSNIKAELLPIIGALKFRTSFGQNILIHSMECAYLAENIARELNMKKEDIYKAKLGAFFHDIGKARDSETQSDHVVEGIKIAKEFNFAPEIAEVIEKHHSSNIEMSWLVSIAKVADVISAARPGARLESSEKYFQRLANIEKICNEIPGVDKTFALQAGREIRIMVKPAETNDDGADEIAVQAKKLISDIIKINGNINITVIREYIKKETIERNKSFD